MCLYYIKLGLGSDHFQRNIRPINMNTKLVFAFVVSLFAVWVYHDSKVESWTRFRFPRIRIPRIPIRLPRFPRIPIGLPRIPRIPTPRLPRVRLPWRFPWKKTLDRGYDVNTRNLEQDIIEKRHFADSFQIVNTNGDGWVSIGEWFNAFAQDGDVDDKEDLEFLFLYFDEDNSGGLDIDEWEALTKADRKDIGEDLSELVSAVDDLGKSDVNIPPEKSNFADSFKIIDTDGDGWVSPQEWVNALVDDDDEDQDGNDGNQEELDYLQAVFSDVDTDKNGGLDIDEWEALVKANDKNGGRGVDLDDLVSESDDQGDRKRGHEGKK